ncbi:MAG: hypothetical protein JST06_06695 [Bacteroidetes bacterium]|nr:hypothetical protein [Bacteroidota bacterium]MBS1629895.1 hypothetical protein [Bacteroidota bacterium]
MPTKKSALDFALPDSGGSVYELIIRLDSTEKSIVRKYWSRQSGPEQRPLHVRLFEEICSGNISDDNTAKASLDNIGSAQLSNLKLQLQNEVLKALSLSSRNHSPVYNLHMGFMQLRALEERCQWQMARKLCKKLWDISEHCGQYNFSLELLFRRSKLIEQRTYQAYEAEAAEIHEQIIRYTYFRLSAQQIRYHTDKLSLLRTTDQFLNLPESRTLTIEARAAFIALNIDASETPNLRFRYLAGWAICTYLLQQYQDCTDATNEALSLLDAKPDLALLEPDSLIQLANISCYNGFAENNILWTERVLDQFTIWANEGPNTPRFRYRWEAIFFHNTLKIAHKKADYERVAALMDDDAQRVLDQMAIAVPPLESLAIGVSMAISLFVLERYDDAEQLLLVLKDRNRNLVRDDISYFILTFQLAILFELKDWRRLSSAIEAAYQAFYKRGKLRPFEKDIMSFLKSLLTNRTHKESIRTIEGFLPRLEQYRSDQQWRSYLLFFNYYDWLQSKLAGLSYREYKKQLLAMQNAQNPE